MKRKAGSDLSSKNPRYGKKRNTATTTTTIVKNPGRAPVAFVARSLGNAAAYTERKYFDSERTGATVDAITSSWGAGTIVDTIGAAALAQLCIFAPIQGDDIFNRTGRRVDVLSIRIKGTFIVPQQTNATTADGPPIIRYLLVQDNQTNGAQMTPASCIASGLAASQAWNMSQSTASFGRFKVLKDKYITLQNPAISWDGTDIEQNGLARQFKINYKFNKPVRINYNASNGGTVADVVNTSFHFLCGASNIQLAPTLSYMCRTVFMDA